MPTELSMTLAEMMNEHKMLCPKCQEVRLSIDFLDGECFVCRQVEIDMADAEAKQRIEQRREQRIMKAALSNLVKNHRSELDHLISEERFKQQLLARDHVGR